MIRTGADLFRSAEHSANAHERGTGVVAGARDGLDSIILGAGRNRGVPVCEKIRIAVRAGNGLDLIVFGARREQGVAGGNVKTQRGQRDSGEGQGDQSFHRCLMFFVFVAAIGTAFEFYYPDEFKTPRIIFITNENLFSL